jgi:hypothetical protein
MPMLEHMPRPEQTTQASVHIEHHPGDGGVCTEGGGSVVAMVASSNVIIPAS